MRKQATTGSSVSLLSPSHLANWRYFLLRHSWPISDQSLCNTLKHRSHVRTQKPCQKSTVTLSVTPAGKLMSLRSTRWPSSRLDTSTSTYAGIVSPGQEHRIFRRIRCRYPPRFTPGQVSSPSSCDALPHQRGRWCVLRRVDVCHKCPGKQRTLTGMCTSTRRSGGQYMNVTFSTTSVTALRCTCRGCALASQRQGKAWFNQISCAGAKSTGRLGHASTG